MPDYKLKYYSQIDRCIYCWDEVNKKWLKVCDADVLPDDVKEQFKRDTEMAEITLDAAKHRQGG